MTYSLKITPFTAAMLAGFCRAAGSSLKTTLGHHITQQAPAAATLAAASAEAPLPTAAPAIPEPPAAPAATPPEPAAATTPQPMNPAEEDALLAVLGA